MKSSIYNFVEELLNAPVKNEQFGERHMSAYENLSQSLDELYLSDDAKEELGKCYTKLLERRESLCSCEYIDFTSANSDFAVKAVSYLESLRCFLNFLFKESRNYSYDVCLKILKQIVEGDTEPVTGSEDGEEGGDAYYKEGTRTIRVNIGNPLILESLFLARLQYDDFREMYSFRVRKGDVLYKGSTSAMYVLYSEIFGNKAEKLFTDIVLLRDRQFFRIVDIDRSRCQFIARSRDDLSSCEKIEAFELYEKIVYASPKIGGLKCLIIGDVPKLGREILGGMLSTGKDIKYTIDYLDDRAEIQRLIADCGEFLKKIRLYDKVFVLDCPDIYRNHSYVQAYDDTSVLQNSSDGFSSLLSKKNMRGGRDFDNRNGFVELYYRVQNCLVVPDSHNMVRERFVNRKFLYFMNSYFVCDIKGRLVREDLTGKELYVYFSGSEDFKNDRFDSLDIARVERHDSKEWRSVKFSARKPVSYDSREKKIKTSFYDILNNVSVSGDFLCEMTGERGRGFDVKKICRAVQIARNTSVEIRYGKITSSGSGGNRMRIWLRVGYPSYLEGDEERLKRYRDIVSSVLKEAFGRHSDSSRYESRVLIDEFRDSFSCAVYDAARNYNDMLFWHIYSMPAKKDGTDVAIEIGGGVQFTPADSMAVWENDAERMGYTHRKTAGSLIRDIDSETFSKADIMEQTNMVSRNGEKLEDYICSLRMACVNLGYTYGDMYLRMQKYYF